ncbi:MAG: TrkA family potassium uptake protein [Acaryochloridaceae cyanobacterium CSU_3_4]|nr:TrkA family potassium uptake protein [Acaryochloridaceae cyanobacterium CSU_3_4]
MNPSFSLFPGLKQKNHQFAVIGLGRFGRAACQTLHQAGYEVLGTDIDEKRVTEVLNNQWAAHVLQLDSTNPTALKEAGIYEFDTVIIAIGNYLQESIITTLNVKEAGVAKVIAKASTEIHGKLLKRVGADQVIFPEYEAGYTLARALTKPSILDRFELDPQHSIVEIAVPEEFDNKSIGELQLRSRYSLNVLAICRDQQFNINPSPSFKLKKGSVMVVIGETQAIDKLPF